MIKVVYVTGCCGFIGAYVTEACLEQGWHVIGVDKLTYASNPERIADFETWGPNAFKFIKSDINDLDRLYDCDYIINTAAETHVDNSIISSKEFLHSNVNGVHHLLELIRTKERFRMPTLLHFSCYDERTRALTREGIKEYHQIKIGDEVLSINPDNGKMEFKKVLKIIIQDYNGKMIHFKHKSDDLMVTPNHRMYFRKNGKIQVDVAERACHSYGQTYLRGIKNGNTSDINVKGIGICSAKDLFYISGVFIGDGFTAHQIKVIENKSGLKRKDYLILGRDAKGRFKKMNHIGENDKCECNSYRIYFDVPVKDKARKRLEDALTNLKIQWHPEKNKSGEHIYFSSKEWMEYFSQFGKYAENKTIPNWMFDYDHSILMELYNGLIDSDGYWNKSKTGSLTTVSYNLVQKSCLLGYCLGFYMKYSSYKQSDKIPIFKNGRKIKSRKKSYQVFFNTQNIGCGGDKYKSESYNGKIWCLTVEDNKNFVVERNGLFKISGNTDEVYGDISNGSHTETDLLKPSNPYSATKAAADMLIMAWNRTFKVPYIIVRPTNNYGTGQYTEKLIPKTCKNFLLGKKIPLHNNGTPTRIWLHAKDTASAIITIINKGVQNDIFNISGNEELSNLKLVEKIVQCLMESRPTINTMENFCDFSYHREGQDVRYSLDDSKLRKLGWNNKCILDRELPTVVSYYKNKFVW